MYAFQVSTFFTCNCLEYIPSNIIRTEAAVRLDVSSGLLSQVSPLQSVAV